MIEVAAFAECHIEEAASLFTLGYKRLRASFPYMPSCHEDTSAIVPLLSDLSTQSAGAVALADGKVVGYLIGMHIPEFKGLHPGVYCPEWANAATFGNEDAINTALFQYLSPEWSRNGAVTYAITILAGSESSLDAWFWNGFGVSVIDAVRQPVSINAVLPDGLQIRQVKSNDLTVVTNILANHNHYLSLPPVSLFVDNNVSKESICNRLDQTDHVMWIAEMDGNVIGLIEAADGVSGAAYIVSAGHGLGIKCAHVMPEWRGCGVASALLDTALTWAREHNCEICSVDFETFNPTARRFWLRYFSPVCISIMRRIDERTICTRSTKGKKYG